MKAWLEWFNKKGYERLYIIITTETAIIMTLVIMLLGLLQQKIGVVFSPSKILVTLFLVFFAMNSPLYKKQSIAERSG